MSPLLSERHVRCRAVIRIALCLALLAGVSLAQEKTDFVAKASAATVFIKTDSGAGSGFIVRNDGTIVTSLHVVDGAKKVSCKLADGEIFDRVSLIATDERRDIAVLRVPGFGMPTIALGDSSKVLPGQRVIAIGNPLGLEKLNRTVSDGLVSGLRDLDSGYKVLQISAAISPGNSGGPILNEAGEVIGIAAFKLTRGENLNFAVPINYARGLIDQPQAQPLKVWESRPSDSPFGSDNEEVKTGLTDYWKSSQGMLFYVKDHGDQVKILNMSNTHFTYDFRWVQGYIVGRIYGSNDFCLIKKVDDDHLQRACWNYKSGVVTDAVIAEGVKRLAKPRDIWIRVR